MKIRLQVAGEVGATGKDKVTALRVIRELGLTGLYKVLLSEQLRKDVICIVTNVEQRGNTVVRFYSSPMLMKYLITEFQIYLPSNIIYTLEQQVKKTRFSILLNGINRLSRVNGGSYLLFSLSCHSGCTSLLFKRHSIFWYLFPGLRSSEASLHRREWPDWSWRFFCLCNDGW